MGEPQAEWTRSGWLPLAPGEALTRTLKRPWKGANASSPRFIARGGLGVAHVCVLLALGKVGRLGLGSGKVVRGRWSGRYGVVQRRIRNTRYSLIY